MNPTIESWQEYRPAARHQGNRLLVIHFLRLMVLLHIRVRSKNQVVISPHVRSDQRSLVKKSPEVRPLLKMKAESL